jgi:septal ring factor EnvC (AmiA/AmiB activator)
LPFFTVYFERVLELENSLKNSKRQMEKLKKQLKREEQHKQCLEQELVEDQRKIKELEQKYNLQASKVQYLKSNVLKLK